MKLPIIRHPRKEPPYKIPIKTYNSWICHEPEEIFFDDDSEEYSSESDEDNSVYRDSNNNRIGGLFTYVKDDLEYMIIMNKGYTMRTYIYPHIKIPFYSPMVRWWNLFYCGGFFIHGPNGENYSTDMNIVDAVINKQKPIGFAYFDNNKMPKVIEKVKKTGLPYSISPGIIRDDYSFIGISQLGTFGKLFDINQLLKSYALMDQNVNIPLLDKSDEKFFRSLKNKPLSYWLNDWDYARPGKSNRDLALTGLLLGYPIESTVSIMLQ